MKLYKAVINPTSSFTSALQSDTFFGAFCWSYLYLYGEDALVQLINNYKKGSPDIIFSNAFSVNRLPMPFGISDSLASTHDNTNVDPYKKYIEDKKLKDTSEISLDDFNLLINGNFTNQNMAENPPLFW